MLKAAFTATKCLDGKAVDKITAYLFHAGSSNDPHRLRQNDGKSFQGSIVLGMGFTFDDTDTTGLASSLNEMCALIEDNPRNAERLFPYIGGEEVNSHPQHLHHRFVIDFADLDEASAKQWPDLYEIVRERVRPQRQQDKRLAYRKYWWQFAEKRGDLRSCT